MNKIKVVSYLIVILALLLSSGVLFGIKVHADQLSNRSVTLSDSRARINNVAYDFRFTRPNNGVIGSIEFEICSNDPFPGSPCTIPAGFSFVSASISSQIGISGLSIHSSSTNNKLILTRVANNVPSGPLEIIINGVTNPDLAGSYFLRIRTFTSIDASGSEVDWGGLAFAIVPEYSMSTEVPPFLYFCVAVTIPGYNCAASSGSYVDMGELSSTQANAKTSQFVIATNADFGYVVFIVGTQPTSGNNFIPALTVLTPSNRGTSQFGINLRDNNDPNVGQNPVGTGPPAVTAEYNVVDKYKFVSGDAIVLSGTTSNYMKYTTTYLINVNKNQKPGIYTTTLIYIATATF